MGSIKTLERRIFRCVKLSRLFNIGRRLLQSFADSRLIVNTAALSPRHVAGTL